MSLAQWTYARVPAALQNVLLNAYAWGVARHRYGGSYRRMVVEALERERWPIERLRDYQVERLRIVLQAAQGSAWQRARLAQSGLDARALREPEDLRALPLLTKADVREHEREMMTRSRPGSGWLNGHTSGTTGSPLSVWYDRRTCIVNNAIDRRQKVWGGATDDAWMGLLLGRVIVPPAARRPPYWRVNHVLRQVWFSSFHMSDATLGAYVAEMRRRGLQFLEGYPSTLYVVARYLARRGETLPLRAAFSSSETLLDVQRETIEQAFACRLFDFYGLAERVVYAGECETHAGKHVAEDFGWVEIVGEDGTPVPPGEPGYIVGTSLHNTAMPMLRYRTSDLSAFVLEPCPCGRPFRRLRNVTTKAEDFVITPDGRLISPSILTHPFKPLHGIAESQVVQDRPDRILVKLVPPPGSTLPDAEVARLVSALRERIGPDMQVDVEQVSAIPRERSGKFRWVVSTVEHPYRLSWDQQAR